MTHPAGTQTHRSRARGAFPSAKHSRSRRPFGVQLCTHMCVKCAAADDAGRSALCPCVHMMPYTPRVTTTVASGAWGARRGHRNGPRPWTPSHRWHRFFNSCPELTPTNARGAGSPPNEWSKVICTPWHASTASPCPPCPVRGPDFTAQCWRQIQVGTPSTPPRGRTRAHPRETHAQACVESMQAPFSEASFPVSTRAAVQWRGCVCPKLRLAPHLKLLDGSEIRHSAS